MDETAKSVRVKEHAYNECNMFSAPRLWSSDGWTGPRGYNLIISVYELKTERGACGGVVAACVPFSGAPTGGVGAYAGCCGGGKAVGGRGKECTGEQRLGGLFARTKRHRCGLVRRGHPPGARS